MILEEEYIKNITPDANFRWAKRHYKLHGILDYLKIEKDGDTYYINSTINDRYNDYNVEIELDKKRMRIMSSCECYFARNEGLCGHAAATLMIINLINPTSFPFEDKGEFEAILNQIDKENEIKQNRLRIKNELEKTNRALQQLSSDFSEEFKELFISTPKYQLYSECEVNYHINQLLMRFKVGLDKKYIVKNINSFLQAVYLNDTIKYGKFLEFKHSLDNFDEHTKSLINILYRVVNRMEYNYNAKDVYFQYSDLDNVFDLFLNVGYEYTDTIFSEKNIKLRLNIGMIDENHYTVHLIDRYIYTNKYVYYFDFGLITRIKCPQSEQLARLVSYIESGQLKRLDKAGLDELMNVISSLSDNIECEFDFEYKYESLESQINVYLDIENSLLEIGMECEYEDGSSSFPFEDEKNTSFVVKSLKDYLLSLGDVDGKYLYIALYSNEMDQFIYEDLDKLKSYCEIYMSDSFKKVLSPKPVSLNVGIKAKSNLLEIDLSSFNFDIKELKDIISSYKKEKKYHHLKNGDIISLDSMVLDEITETFDNLNINYKNINQNKIKLPIYRAYELDNIDNNNIIVKREESFNKLIDKLNNPKKYKINKHYDSILRHYQVDGVEWMMKLHSYGLGGILADDMGLGKTLQTIAFLESIKLENHCLIICPAVLLYNWQDEVVKFAKELNCVVVSGNQSDRKDIINNLNNKSLIITTYDYIRSDVKLYTNVSLDYLILDEGHYIKNHKTKSSKAVKSLEARNRLVLTGTPIENTLAELWSLFDFLMQGYLYDYSYFQKEYESKIIKKQDEVKQNRLKKMVAPFILRRTKKEVLNDLPDKIEQVISFRFNQDEQYKYLSKVALINKDLKEQVKLNKVNKVMILSMLTQLRQICCDSRLVFNDVSVPSSKLKGCIELIETQIESQKKILVFSAFTSMLDLIKEELEKRFIDFRMLTGSVSKENRQILVNEFQAGKVDVFLISLKAGGVGLNLTAANTVIHFDPWWNISAQNQATDRAYRIGQTDDVQVYKLIMKDSIEEKIITLQESKHAISEMFVENSDGSIASMNVDDIIDLLKF